MTTEQAIQTIRDAFDYDDVRDKNLAALDVLAGNVLPDLPDTFSFHLSSLGINEYEAYISDCRGRFIMQKDQEYYAIGKTPREAMLNAISKIGDV